MSKSFCIFVHSKTTRMKFGAVITYKSKLDFIEKVLDIYISVNDKAEKLIIREKQALAYYMLYGYSEETVKEIETSLPTNINSNYVRMINSSLKSKGYLIKDEKNYKKKILSPEIEKLKDYFIDKGGKTFTIGFLKGE